MGRTPRELLASMDMDELIEWQAYYRIDPWGGERQDIGFAIVASNLVNMLRADKGVATLAEFTPDYEGAAIEAAEKNDLAIAKKRVAKMKAAMIEFTLNCGGIVQ